MPNEAATGPASNLQARASLRRHALAAAAHFAAQAQVEIDDEALALIAEFMIAVTLTDVHNSESISPLPHAVMAAARLLFSRDEMKIARAEVRKEGQLASSTEGERDARGRAEETVARFFAEVESGASIGEGDQTLKRIHSRRIWRGKVDHATAMARLIAAWRERRKREQLVAKELRALKEPRPPKIQE